MDEHEHLGVVGAAQRHAKKIAHANVDRHPHAVDGAPQNDAFAVKFDLPHAAVRASVVRMEAYGQRKGVEPQCAARPGGIDPACCSLTPHGPDLPAGIMFPVDTRDRSRAVSVLAYKDWLIGGH